MNTKNKSGQIGLLIFLLICGALGIAAFVMSFTKKCGEGFGNFDVKSYDKSLVRSLHSRNSSSNVTICTLSRGLSYNNDPPPKLPPTSLKQITFGDNSILQFIHDQIKSTFPTAPDIYIYICNKK